MSEIGGEITQQIDAQRHDLSMFVHERASESAYHADILMWELASIIWGANTLLLGFILEAIDNAHARLLIIPTCVVGVVLTLFVAHLFHLGKIGQGIAYGMCREIERDFPEKLRLHSTIHADYENPARRSWLFGIVRGKAKHWVGVITVLFLCLWLGTLAWAIRLEYVRDSPTQPALDWGSQMHRF